MNPIFKLFVKVHVWLYGVSGGRFGATMNGMHVILLTTTGKKTGKSRTVPVVSHFDGGQLYVIASMGGAPQNPAWYGNLTAHPEVTVQVKGDRFVAKAQTVAEGADRDRLWKDIKTQMPQFAGYEAKTKRVIPVVKLVRAAAA
ncbi:MAG TPA: nitroreductase family deazaflavin-dependent oxidoreductase [Polyangiaceae bacterium]